MRAEAFLDGDCLRLAYGNQNRAVLGRFIERIRAAGYSLDPSAPGGRLGVPQLRQRLFCVGLRMTCWTFNGRLAVGVATTRLTPGPTRPERDGTALFRPIGRSEALDGLTVNTNPPDPRKSSQDIREELREVPPGDNYLYWTARRGIPTKFKWRSRYWTFLLSSIPTTCPDDPRSTWPLGRPIPLV